MGSGKSRSEIRVTSAPACASSSVAAAATLALSEPVRSEPGITRIFSADMICVSFWGAALLLFEQDHAQRRAVSVLAIHPDAGRRKVHPDALGGFCGNAGQRFRNRRR